MPGERCGGSARAAPLFSKGPLVKNPSMRNAGASHKRHITFAPLFCPLVAYSRAPSGAAAHRRGTRLSTACAAPDGAVKPRADPSANASPDRSPPSQRRAVLQQSQLLAERRPPATAPRSSAESHANAYMARCQQEMPTTQPRAQGQRDGKRESVGRTLTRSRRGTLHRDAYVLPPRTQDSSGPGHDSRRRRRAAKLHR